MAFRPIGSADALDSPEGLPAPSGFRPLTGMQPLNVDPNKLHAAFQEPMGVGEASAHGFLQGYLADFEDEGLGAAAHAATGMPYNEARDRVRVADEQAWGEHPVAYGLSKFAGTVAPGPGLLNAAGKMVAPLTKGLGKFAGRAVTGAAEGLAGGAMFGAGASTAPDAAGVAADTAKGAGIGAAGGAALAPTTGALIDWLAAKIGQSAGLNAAGAQAGAGAAGSANAGAVAGGQGAAAAQGGAAGATNESTIIIRPPKRLADKVVPVPEPIPQAQYLLDKGVPLTGGLRNPESPYAYGEIASQSTKLAGPAIRRQRLQARQAAMDLAFTEARPPGAPQIRPSGDINDKFAALDQAWDDAYGAVKAQLGDVAPQIAESAESRAGRTAAAQAQAAKATEEINAKLAKLEEAIAWEQKRVRAAQTPEQAARLNEGVKQLATQRIDLLGQREAAQRAASAAMQQDNSVALTKAIADALDNPDIMASDQAKALVRGYVENQLTKLRTEKVANASPDVSWREFVKARMGPYMKEMGSHGAAIKRIGEEWRAASGRTAPDLSNTSVSAADLLNVRSDIRKRARELLSGGGDEGIAKYRLLHSAQDVITQAIESQAPPEAAQALRALDRKYPDFKIIEQAVYSAGDAPNGLTPSMLSRSVRSHDPMVNDYSAGGGGDLRALSKAISTVFDESAMPPTGARVLSAEAPWIREFLAPPTILLRNRAAIKAQGGAAAAKAASGAAAGASTSAAAGAQTSAGVIQRVARVLSINPAALGPYGAALKAVAQQRGPEALAAAHYVLVSRDPNYAALVAQLPEEEQPDQPGPWRPALPKAAAGGVE